MTSSLQYFDAERVRSVLNWPMVTEAVEESMKAVANSQQESPAATGPVAYQPTRSLTFCNDNKKVLLAMPGYVGNYQLPSVANSSSQQHSTLACKLVTSFSNNAQQKPPLPNILANILLFSTETGQLQCVMDGTEITAWRTAAASIVASKYLYFCRFGDTQRSIKLAVIGTGVEGSSHALGMCATFNVSEVKLWNRTVMKAEALAEKLRAVAPNTKVQVSENAAAAVDDADVICVATYSAEALVTADMLKKRNVHINTIGAGQVHFGEVGQDVYDLAKVYIDSWANAKSELKDLKAELVAEVGEVINSGKYPPEEGVTIFQSMGMAVEDATTAQAIYEALKIKSEEDCN